MALFRDTTPGTRDTPTSPPEAPTRASEAASEPIRRPVEPPTRGEPASAPRAEIKESFIAAELTLEGKIEGAGSVRVAGRFKGDVNVQGDLTIERGAHLAGQVTAKQVFVEGTLEGNVTSAERVELRQSGVLNGDVKARTVTVAAGARMRGAVDFGGDESAAAKPSIRGVG